MTHSHAAAEVRPTRVYKALLGRSDHKYDRDYAALVKDSLIAAVKEARSKLEPARIAVGQGISVANINQGAKDVDGRTNSDLIPEGYVNGVEGARPARMASRICSGSAYQLGPNSSARRCAGRS